MIKTFLLLSLFIIVKPLFIPISKLVTKNRPHKVEVLDKDLVIWWNKNTNRWCALDDMCRHRQSSLSKGLITNSGNVKCLYHGWEYNKCGNCIYTPSVEKDLNIKTTSYNIIEKNEMLWLTDNDDNNIDIFDNLLNNNHIKTPWFTEDISDCTYDLVMENALDFIHFNQTHNIGPFSRYGEQTILTKKNFDINWYNETGFSINIGPAIWSYYAPYTVTFNIYSFTTAIYAIPITKNKTKFISNLLIPYKNEFHKNMLNSFLFITNPLFIKFGRKLFGEDLTQFKSQHYYIQKTGHKKYTKIEPDIPISLFNKWIREYKNTTITTI